MPTAPSRRLPRVHDEPGFILHRHDWSESSLILEVLTRQHGRVVLVAKGVKKPTSQFRPVLLPLQPIRLSWSGDAEVRTLKAAQWQGGHLMPAGDALLAGCYLNELLLKFLARDDPHPLLFDHYTQAVRQLATGATHAAVLRSFELLLLQATGFLPSLDQEGSSLQPPDPAAAYQLRPEEGLWLAREATDMACSGAFWLALQVALAAPIPMDALYAAVAEDRSGVLRRQLQALLHYHSGVRVFQTRQLLADMQRLAM